MDTHYRIVDLFAGIAGLRQGVANAIQKSGHTSEVVFTSEIKKEAVRILQANFPEDDITGDITEVPVNVIPQHDILLAGFPCQAFSYAGKREGFADTTRGTLFFDVLRVLKHHKPQHFILENVEGLVTHDADPTTQEGRTLKVILTALAELGYTVHWGILNATDYGVPQARKRVFITGTLTDAPEEAQPTLNSFLTQNPAKPLHSVLQTGVTEADPKLIAFEALLQQTHPDLRTLEGKIFRDWRGGDRNMHSWNIHFKGETSTEEKLFLEQLMAESKRSHWSKQGITRKGEGFPLTPQQISTALNHPHESTVTMLRNLTQLGYVGEDNNTYRIMSGRLTMPVSHIVPQNSYVNTLTATDADRLCIIDSSTHKLRRFTETEVKRLFGFPDNYILPTTLPRSKMFDVFGNSVVIPVAEAVASWLLQQPEK